MITLCIVVIGNQSNRNLDQLQAEINLMVGATEERPRQSVEKESQIEQDQTE